MIHKQLFDTIKRNDSITLDLTLYLAHGRNIGTDDYRENPIVKARVLYTQPDGGFMVELPNGGLVEVKSPQHVIDVEFGN